MNGSVAGRRRLAWLGMALVAALVAAVNAASTLDDMSRAGLSIEPYAPWIWEVGSAVFAICVVPLMWRASRWLRRQRRRWQAMLCLAALILGYWAAHMAWFALTRPPAYALFGGSYRFDLSRAQLLYELRKDVMTALLLVGTGWLVDLWTDQLSKGKPAEPAPGAPPFRLEVRDGNRVHFLAPHEIESVVAAGNYVELQAASGAMLHRATLVAVGELLAPHGFVRIHRSRLVRRDAVKSVVATPAGDFEVTLASGATVAGSRRYRDRLTLQTP